MIIAHTNGKNIELRCNQVFSDESEIIIENSVTIDLVNIFLEIYVADIGIKRKGDQPRNISIEAYVDNKNMLLWKDNLYIIQKLANFVTEGDNDKWNISLVPVDYVFDAQQISILNTEIDNISLLSGGLDSFCGAYYNEINGKKTLYCGYKTSNVDVSSINRVSAFLHERSGNLGVCTYSKVKVNKVTYTQRTRSLLFFTSAVLTALKENVSNVNINENGIMTLNPSFQSRGTTKTTHPKTIYLYQKLLDNIGIDVKLNHPFLFSTKGEMVNSLSLEYKKYIKDTRSCSRSMHDPRYDTSSTKSCGTCVPCLLRKISMAAYDLEDFDNDYIVPYSGDVNDEEYLSAISYYTTFYNSVISNQIFSELLIKKKFYAVPDYYERTYEMLKKFSAEFEVFIKKYGG